MEINFLYPFEKAPKEYITKELWGLRKPQPYQNFQGTSAFLYRYLSLECPSISLPFHLFASSNTSLLCIIKCRVFTVQSSYSTEYVQYNSIYMNSAYASAAWACKVNFKGTEAVADVNVLSSFIAVNSWELKKHNSLCSIISSDWYTLQTTTQKVRF